MKSWIAGLVVVCMSSGLGFLDHKVSAQDAPATRPTAPTTEPTESGALRMKPGEYLLRLRERVNALNLSDEQKTKIAALFDQAQSELKSSSELTDPAERRQKTVAAFQTVRDGLKEDLTSEQLQKLQSQLPGNGRAGGGGRAGQMLQRLHGSLQQLSLSEDQKKQVANVLKSARDQFEQIRDDAQKAGGDAREKVMAAVRETRQKIENILTPEQKQKLRQIRDANQAPGSGSDNSPSGSATGPS